MSSQKEELTDAINKLDMEQWMDYQGIDYRRTHGSRGEQLNVRACPCCGNTFFIPGAAKIIKYTVSSFCLT